jgi:hypothetical protein
MGFSALKLLFFGDFVVGLKCGVLICSSRGFLGNLTFLGAP